MARLCQSPAAMSSRSACVSHGLRLTCSCVEAGQSRQVILFIALWSPVKAIALTFDDSRRTTEGSAD
jgi:hypothetical protein